MDTLDDLVEEAYRLFSDYEMGDELAVCTGCCVSRKEALLLKTQQLKQMPTTLIYSYLDAAVITGESILIQQMKYLLPRVLELMVRGEYLRHSREIILNKCSCRSDLWSTAEIDFMQRFALTYFTRQFDSYEATAESPEALVMLHLAGLDVMPLLTYWQRHMNDPMVLWGAVVLIEDCSQTGFYHNAFADNALSSLIAEWLGQVETRNAIRAAILAQIETLTEAGLPVSRCEIIFDWI